MIRGIYQWVNNVRSQKNNVRRFPTVQYANKVLACLSLGLTAECEGVLDKDFLKIDELTHEQCIKQACLLSVNAASTLLTTTASAVLDTCNHYKNSLNRILSLLEEVQMIDDDNPQTWDAIVEARAHVNEAKSSLAELNCYMETVEKVVNSTTEAAFLAGADYMCTALCERLYSAQKEINDQIEKLKKLEENYIKLQSEIVSKDKESNGEKKKTSR